jgi:hypothetical protein
MTDELLLDCLEIAADRFEDLRQVGGDGHFLRCVAQWKYVRFRPKILDSPRGVNALSRCCAAD